MIETVVGPEIAGLAASVIKAMRFHGIAGALEFKRHALTGRLHFIEINPRAASSIAAANASGANLPYLAYLDAIGAELPGMTVGETPVRWIEARHDVLYWLSYRKSDHTGQALPLREYLGSLRGRRDDAGTGPRMTRCRQSRERRACRETSGWRSRTDRDRSATDACALAVKTANGPRRWDDCGAVPRVETGI